jgi:DNA-binding MarR family transcriptional regulator
MTNTNISRKTAIVVQEFIKDLNSQMKSSRTNNQISAARISIIHYLIDKGPQTLMSLARYRKVSAASMSRLVASLVSQGWVLRANSKHDGRSKIFIITLKGKHLAMSDSERELEIIESIIKDYSKQQQVNLGMSVQVVQMMINSYFHVTRRNDIE